MSRRQRSTGARAGVGPAQEPSTGDDAVAYAAC